MPIRKSKKNASEPDFERAAKELGSTAPGKQVLCDFAIAIAGLLDGVIGDDNTWFNVGCSRSTYQPMVTLHIDRDVEYASGRTLEEFMLAVKELTEPL